jgi:Cu-Zn family superoxide dismutase
MRAVAFFGDGSSPKESMIKGFVEFSQQDPKSQMTINFNLSGFDPLQVHAIHIHEFGDLRLGCKSLGGHFNPTNRSHSHSGEGHAGDLFNNLISDDDGNFVYIMKTYNLSLFHNSNMNKCVIGRSVVIHKFMDDYGLQGLFLSDGIFVPYDEMDINDLREICKKLGYEESNRSRKDMVTRLNKESITTGNASKRIACAIIGISK